MKIEPIWSNVLFRKLDWGSMVGQVHVPKEALEQNTIPGEVIAVGSGGIGADGEERPVPVRVGQKILIPTKSPIYPLTMLQLQRNAATGNINDEYMVVKASHILAIIHDSDGDEGDDG